ncbi:MAG: sulfotransferase [Pseudanabaenales cyanobacterium]|nr:sulfotransferase [Pseudanabaenales cyanobacterium]
MLNTKVIVISGFARGGTNIAWNLLQSHPEICSPIYETGELFYRSWALWFCRLLAEQIIDYQRIIDNQLFRFKLLSLKHPDDRFIAEGELYTHEQIANTALCLKSVNRDIFLTDLLLKVYPDLYFIALTRNGYALVDGYLRRGRTAARVGQLYYQISEEMKRYADVILRFKMIKFEDILQNPFEVIEDLSTFLDVCPRQLEKLRFKSKKVITEQGEHRVIFGKERRKYWFDRESINQILEPNVNQRQIDRLSDEMIDEFNREASPALEFFGYEKYG